MAPAKLAPCLATVAPPTANQSAIYRRASSKNGFPTLDGVITLYELFSRSAEAHADLPALGRRPIGPDGAAGEYEFMTYGEAAAAVADAAGALAAAGLKKGARVGVYGANCPEWMIAMQACNRMSYECVPLYDSLGEDAIEFILRHSGATAAFVASGKLPKLAQALAALSKPTSAPSDAEEGEGEGGEPAPRARGACPVKTVVWWGANAPDAAVVKAVEALGAKVSSWDAALKAGAAAPAAPVPPKPEDHCTIMYTSGTTGDPKGVLLKHSAVVAAVSSVVNYCTELGYEMTPADSMLSYLPLAHIFDRVAEELLLHVGGRIGYFQGDTTKIVDDIGALKPTLFIGVPRIFDRIYAAVTGQISKASPVKRFLFNWGFSRKRFFLQHGAASAGASPFFDRLVFSKVKRRLGGRVRVIISGGAPLAPHVEEFLRVAMCAPVCQGYGLTECCAAGAIAQADDWGQFATNGPPLPCIELRFESVPEMGYDATGDDPAGEVLLRGPCLFDGYYKAQDKTDEVLDKDGWFHTGDIGRLTAEGGLKIVDRKKNIFKLSQGEYIAVEKLEATYAKAPPVEQVWVYGDSYQPKLVAVVVPKRAELEAWAASAGVKAGADGDYAALCAAPAAAKWVLGELLAAAKADKLKGFERVAAVHLEPEAFSVEADLMTPTFKLKRPQLKKRYQGQIDAMYAALEAAPAAGGAAAAAAPAAL